MEYNHYASEDIQLKISQNKHVPIFFTLQVPAENVIIFVYFIPTLMINVYYIQIKNH